MLSVDDIPRFVRVYDENMQIETKLASLTDGDPFLRNIVSNTENVLFLLLMGRSYNCSNIFAELLICI